MAHTVANFILGFFGVLGFLFIVVIPWIIGMGDLLDLIMKKEPKNWKIR